MKYCIVSLCLFYFSAQAHPGVGIVMDTKGNVYYTDLKHVWKIDVSGRKHIVVENVHTHELAIDDQNNLYGEHLWYEGERTNKWGHYVWTYHPESGFLKIVQPTEGFRSHYSFVRDQDGNMYWANRETNCQQITRRDKQGHEHSYSNQCLHNIRQMTSTANGIIFAIDRDNLKKIEPNGKVTILALQLPEKSWSSFFVEDPHQLMGLSVDDDQNVYIAAYGNKKVKKVTPFGEVTTVAETNMMWSPTGVLAAPTGELWVLESTITNEVRVERFKKNGERVVY